MLNLAGGGLTLSGASTVDALAISGGAMDANQTLSIETLDFSGGTLSGSGAVAVLGAANWSGGAFSGPGQTDFDGGLFIVGGADKSVSGRTWSTAGCWAGPAAGSWPATGRCWKMRPAAPCGS